MCGGVRVNKGIILCEKDDGKTSIYTEVPSYIVGLEEGLEYLKSLSGAKRPIDHSNMIIKLYTRPGFFPSLGKIKLLKSLQNVKDHLLVFFGGDDNIRLCEVKAEVEGTIGFSDACKVFSKAHSRTISRFLNSLNEMKLIKTYSVYSNNSFSIIVDRVNYVKSLVKIVNKLDIDLDKVFVANIDNIILREYC